MADVEDLVPISTPTGEQTGDGDAVAPSVTIDWPPGILDQQYELVVLPSGATVRVDYHVTYGDLLVASVVILLLVVEVGRILFDRIRGVL